MHRYDALNRYVALLESADGTDDSKESLLVHLENCEQCRAEFECIRHAAASVSCHRFDDVVDEPHLDNLDLAVFAAYGLDAPNAEQAVAHLARCQQCRRQFRQIQRLVEEHENLICPDADHPAEHDHSFLGQVRLVFNDRARILRVVTGFLAWILEWAMLLVVVFQIGVAYLANPEAIGTSPATEFLGIMPWAPLRFWLIAGTCVVLAIFFRWLGAQLYHSAVEQERG